MGSGKPYLFMSHAGIKICRLAAMKQFRMTVGVFSLTGFINLVGRKLLLIGQILELHVVKHCTHKSSVSGLQVVNRFPVHLT